MKNIRRIVLVMACLLCIPGIHAQDFTVTGKVIDNTGLEVIGANISIKGSTGVGTITNIDGQYTLKVNNPAKDVLVISYIGMRTQEVAVKGQKQINVTLQEDSKILDEVVVIGYGTSKRSDLTGSVVSVKNEDLMQTPTSDVAQALAGRMAGVQVMQSEGEPGASVSIRVRGGISITQSNEPLYVIDGFPSEDGMNSLDPGEIETIDILKDASSTAIYGARGANGVVVITTKKGAKDASKMNVSFNSYIGIRKVSKKLDVLSSKEYVLLDYERNLALYGESGVRRFQNAYGSFREIDENYGNREGVDWQEEAFGRVTTSQNYRINISGGNKELKYSLSYNYVKDLGAMIKSGMDRHNISFNISHKASSRFQANARLNYDESKTYGMGTSEGNNRFNKMEHILQYRPVNSLSGNDRDLITGDDDLIDDESNPMQSPILSAQEETKIRKIRSMQANGGFTFNFTKRFSFRNSTGMRYQISRQDIFYGEKSVTGKRSSINGNIAYNENGSFQTSNVFTYDYRGKIHKLNVMAGQEWISRWAKYLGAYATNFPNNDIGLNDMNLGTPSEIRSSVNDDDRLLSFFARANYNFREKYLLTATVRTDGSSKFAKGNQWGIFPSVSAAWNITEEKFMKNQTIFDQLKLRAGFGIVGNQNIDDFAYLSLYNVSYTGTSDTGYTNSFVSNGRRGTPDISWEKQKQWNLGVDMAFLQNRVRLSVDAFLIKNKDLLMSHSLPTTTGFSSTIENIGAIENKGLEFALNANLVRAKDFEWNFAATLSMDKNKVTQLYGDNDVVYNVDSDRNIQKEGNLFLGESRNTIYIWKTGGIAQEIDMDRLNKINWNGYNVNPGDLYPLDYDNNGQIDQNDRVVIGSTDPKFYGGFSTDFSWKGLSLNAVFSYSYGAKKLSPWYETLIGSTGSGVASTDLLDRWTPENTDAEFPRVLAGFDYNHYGASSMDFSVQKASFLRLSALTLAYTFPTKVINALKLANLRVYATGSNLFCLTNYNGYDPETGDWYPPTRMYTFGLNLAF